MLTSHVSYEWRTAHSENHRRKLAGIDRNYISELKGQLNLLSLPQLKVVQMDACDLKFENESFGVVYSRSVFHHLSDPAAAVDGIVRVLKPGGVVVHLVSSIHQPDRLS